MVGRRRGDVAHALPILQHQDAITTEAAHNGLRGDGAVGALRDAWFTGQRAGDAHRRGAVQRRAIQYGCGLVHFVGAARPADTSHHDGAQ